jgi:CheY-like chemotaxis protein
MAESLLSSTPGSLPEGILEPSGVSSTQGESSPAVSETGLRILIAALYGGLELVAQAPALGQAEKERLEAALRRNSHTMKRVLEEVSLYLRLLNGSQPGPPEVVDLQAVSAAAIAEVRSQLETREQSVSLRGASLWAEVDADNLRRCLSSMLGSMSRSCGSGESLELSYSVLPEDRVQFVLAVPGGASRAPGEAVDFREKVVARLAQGLAATVRHPGLDRWELELPCRLAQPPQESPAARLSPSQGRPKVLVVDDNQDGADTLALWLEARGFEVAVAYDGDQGLRELERFQPDLGLFDLGLPRLNGYELSREVRRRGFRGPLIAVTGYGQEKDRELALQAGFDHHLLKPVDPPALEELLRQLLQGSTRHVLVVEDNPVARQVLLRMLDQLGVRAVGVSTAQEGLAAIGQESPALALCDLGLPGELDGFDLARRVRERAGEYSFPLIALTAEVAGVQERALQAGFAQVLEKPLDEATLRTLLGALGLSGRS